MRLDVGGNLLCSAQGHLFGPVCVCRQLVRQISPLCRLLPRNKPQDLPACLHFVLYKWCEYQSELKPPGRSDVSVFISVE